MINWFENILPVLSLNFPLCLLDLFLLYFLVLNDILLFPSLWNILLEKMICCLILLLVVVICCTVCALHFNFLKIIFYFFGLEARGKNRWLIILHEILHSLIERIFKFMNFFDFLFEVFILLLIFWGSLKGFSCV